MADTLNRQSPLQALGLASVTCPKRRESARSPSSPWSTCGSTRVHRRRSGRRGAWNRIAADDSIDRHRHHGSQRDLVRASGMVDLLHHRGGEELEAALRAAVAESSGVAVDVSAQRTTLRLSGADARDVLAKGSSLDLHPSAFGPGTAAQTMLGQANVVLIPLSDKGTDYRILVRQSFARYLAEWLIDATAEFTVAG